VTPRPRVPKQAINAPLNLFLTVLVTTAIALQLFAWPVVLRHYGAVGLWLAVPFVLLAPTHWGLIHEAIHGQLTSSRRLNDGLGRGLAIAFLLPFEAVRFGHLLHHRFTRESYDRPDRHDGKTPYFFAHLGYLARLLGGLYLTELLVPLLACLPARYISHRVGLAISNEGPLGPTVRRHFVEFARNPSRRRRIRRDAVLSIMLHGVAFAVAGRWWPALAGTMYLRGVWLSIADNLPHFDVPLDTPERARNFTVPAMWRWVLMNHHLHQLHHRYPTAPWSALPRIQRDAALSGDAARELDGNAPADLGEAHYFRTALRQFSGFQKDT
jgi:fatty acid desaturase